LKEQERLMAGLKRAFAQQFIHPRGLGGALAGRLMARKNRERIAWAVEELNVQPGDRIMEIGHGPGVAVANLEKRYPECRIFGLDPSSVMHAQASRNNRQAIRKGQTTLRAMSAEAYVGQDAPFDLVFSINTLPFCEKPEDIVRKFSNWMRPRSRFVIVHQVPMITVSASELDERERLYKGWLTGAGLTLLRQQRLSAKPNPVLFLEAQNPE
jgi:trans-aconitate methyltransferase